MSFWRPSGNTNVIVGSGGNPVDCAECPCGTTVTVDCCEVPLPTTLNFTIVGTFQCDGASGTLTWDGSKWHQPQFYAGNCPSGEDFLELQLSCEGTDASGFVLETRYSGSGPGFNSYSPSGTPSCDPLSLTFSLLSLAPCCTIFATIVITE